MESDIFLGVCWDYWDWVKLDRNEIDRRIRLDLNEWSVEFLEEYEEIIKEVVKEVRKDIEFLG